METIDGSRRVADWNALDIRVQKDIRLAGLRVGGFFDIQNATNTSAYQSIASDVGSSSAFGTPAFFVNPRTMMLGAKVRF
jgi:poly(3-hydroxyalkanoate) synthetase